MLADRVHQLVGKRNCEKSVGHLVGVGVRSHYRASRVDPLRMGSGSRGKINRGVSTDSSQETVEHTRTVLKVADDIAIGIYVPSLCELECAARNIERLKITVLQHVTMRSWWVCHHIRV